MKIGSQMKCNKQVDEEPSLEKVAQNDICLAESGFRFGVGDLDFYFLEHNKTHIPSNLLIKLGGIKEAQKI